MLNWIIRRKLAAFEKRYGYDLSYARELLEIDRAALFTLGRAMGFTSYKKDIPRDVYYAGKVVATVAEDCGPCTQLMVSMALEDGVDPRVLAAVLGGDEAALTEGQRLAIAFVRAARDHDLAADAYREQIVARWGKRALVALSFGMVAAKLYPTLKYALGYGQACARIDVAGTLIVPRGTAVEVGAVAMQS
jgi:hypothetical protein